jgi:hypothetical protein
MDAGMLLLVIGLPATAVLIIVTYVRLPDQRGLTRRGVRNALIAAVVLASVLGGLITFLSNCGDGFLCAGGLPQAFAAGLYVGGVAGGFFFWLNIVILYIGLWFKPRKWWAVVAVAVSPLVIVAATVGANAYNDYVFEHGHVGGTFGLEMDGDRLRHVSASGPAACALGVEGDYLDVDGQGPDRDGRDTEFKLRMSQTGVVYGVEITVDQSYAYVYSYTQPSVDAVQLVAGWSRAQGQLSFRDVEPLDATMTAIPNERWAGSFSWTCAAP